MHKAFHSYRLSRHTMKHVSTSIGLQLTRLAESGSYALIADVSQDSRAGNRSLDTACICALLGSKPSPLDPRNHQSQVGYELFELSKNSKGVVDAADEKLTSVCVDGSGG